jgi:tRNA1Val (adenine37-N6)-methyltransferase
MPNHYFQFKQFTIQQEHCAMKVCTDACLFGALAANTELLAHHCLDIGTGTGLLPLMYIQKNNAVIIDAVEIDKAAAQQAKENFEASPWKEKLHIFNEDILTFGPGKRYDLIISNPPFYEGDLRSANENKNKAKHDASLGLQQLLEVIDLHLSDEGQFGVLLPFHRVHYFEELATTFNFQLFRKIQIRQSPIHDYFRGVLFFSRKATELSSTDITIKGLDGQYSNEFTDLLKDYYLNI